MRSMRVRRAASSAGRHASLLPTGSSGPSLGTWQTAGGGSASAAANTVRTTRRITERADDGGRHGRERSGRQLRGRAARRGGREGHRRRPRAASPAAVPHRVRRARRTARRRAPRIDLGSRAARRDPLRRDDRRRRLRERSSAGGDRERIRDGGGGARLPRHRRAPRRSLDGLRLRRRTRAVFGRGRAQSARRLFTNEAHRGGGGAPARTRQSGSSRRRRLQRPAWRETEVRQGGGREASRRAGGARVPRPGRVADSRGQRSGDGDRRLAQRRTRDLALRGRGHGVARRRLPRAGAKAARRRAVGRSRRALGSEIASAKAGPLRSQGGQGAAPARAFRAPRARRRARPVPRGARPVIGAAPNARTSDAPAAAAPPLLDLPRRPSPLAELWRFRQLIALLVVRELKVRYKRSLLGMLWTMLNPLLLMVVYTVVFTTILPAAMPNFSIFLLAGLLPWLYFSTALLPGLVRVLVNQELVRKIRVPQAVFPLSVVGSNLVNFTLSLVPLFLVMLALRQPFTTALLFLPAAAVILTLFCAGVTLLFATATVFFRDVRHLTEVLLQMLLYLSPVLYDLKQLGAHRSWWFQLFRLELKLNPLSYLIPLVRDPVYYGRLPSVPTVAVALLWASGALLVGFAVFTRLEPRHIHHL